MNKTKIVCTIGPASCSKAVLESLIKNGMTVARLNGSHNCLEWHRKVIKLIRSIDRNIGILFDLPGRKIRVKNDGNLYSFAKGEQVVFTARKNCNSKSKVSLNYSGLYKIVKEKDTLLADDGALSFKVAKIKGHDVVCRAQKTGILKSGKGLNTPRIKINTPFVTKTDHQMIKFAIKNKIDWIGVSFVEDGSHIRKVKRILGNSPVRIISKVENQSALDNIDGILKESWGIMIDRGDLGAEIGIEHIGLMQKDIIAKASIWGKPVIVATEMLHSMVHNSHPTKAEVVDISNSILDGASAIMLSAETAVGKHPLATLKLMKKVAAETEKKYDLYRFLESPSKESSIPSAIGKSICEICKEISVKKVICITLTGYAARMISRYRISADIIAVSNTIEKARSFNLLWGTEGIVLDMTFYKDKTDHIVKTAKELWRMGKICDSDLVVFTAVIFPKKGNKMNFIEIHKIEDLRKLFKWKRN